MGLDGNFYGTTFAGASSGGGTVFKITSNGILSTLATFSGTNGFKSYGRTNAGRRRQFLWDYLRRWELQFWNDFKISTNGTFTTVVHMLNSTGSHPDAALTRRYDNNFFSTATQGGAGGWGAVF